MGSFVVDFQEVDRSKSAVVGGKGAHLGELSRIAEISVPPGFCVTTHAFRRALAAGPSLDDLLARLGCCAPDDRAAIGTLSAELRRAIEGIPIPDEVAAAITGALASLRGDGGACAVRSSATGEDTPSASSAGQHDSYLNVTGPPAILHHVSRCWASLYTERAVAYRLRAGLDHRAAQMAVVVQQMVLPRAAGVLFTADPVTSNRTVASVEAGFGVGDSLVSGLVDPDVYTVRDGEVIAKTVRHEPALTEAEVTRLVQLGRRIEAHFGHPQDIEWCLDDGGFRIVQSRPITTLFPIPESGDDENHVYVSVGHQQMMTDPMKPLGLSFWLMTTPRPMLEAGGRLFVDVAQQLASPQGRSLLFGVLGRSDPLMGDALRTILDRGDFIAPLEDERESAAPPIAPPARIDTDPAIVTTLIKRSQASIAALERDIRDTSGPQLLDFIQADIHELRRILFHPQSSQVIVAAMEAGWWLNDHLAQWLGEKNAVDTLTQSVAHNVTSEMGLALLDVADAIRPSPDVVALLETAQDERFLDELPAVAGGRDARDAMCAFLHRYGMRCAGEIDITRPRWSERPTTLLPIILANVRNFEPGAAQRRFEEGRREAATREQELLARLRALPDGEDKAEAAKGMIDRLRAFAGYREYPKYGMVSRYFIYKRALLHEAERLVQAQVLADPEDIFYLRFDELRDLVRTHRADHDLIRERKDAFSSYAALTPPRVITSEGEVIAGSYRRDDIPAGALVGLAVSAGTVEGRARVIPEMGEADLEAGDILVTAYTDPSWTPVFVGITGLVTEVGGLMTHGAVIAREYGLPAVVGVPRATQLIRDGQRIRLHGTEGYVEILGDG